VGINYIAVLVVTVINMALGGFWYSQSGFGRAWLGLVGIRMEDCDPSVAKKGMVIALLSALIRTYVLAWLVALTGTLGILPGLRLGLWIGLGLMAITMAPQYYFPQRPRKLYLIDAGHVVTAVVLSTVILSVW
jgi:hypothetical protein